jgi:hypothetical protein
MLLLIGNQSLAGSGFPTLQKLMKDSAQLVPNPNPLEVTAGRPTVYDTWAFYAPHPDKPGQPKYFFFKRFHRYHKL